MYNVLHFKPVVDLRSRAHLTFQALLDVFCYIPRILSNSRIVGNNSFRNRGVNIDLHRRLILQPDFASFLITVIHDFSPFVGPPFFCQSSQLPGYSPTFSHPACLASSAAALDLTPALQ